MHRKLVQGKLLLVTLGLALASAAGCGDDAAPFTLDAGPDAAVDAGVRGDGATDAGSGLADAAPRDAGTDAGFVGDAGTDAGRDPAPAFRHPVAFTDHDLALQALRILGAPEAGAPTTYCNNCHTLSRARIRYWRALSDASMRDCLTDLPVSSDTSAAAMLTCLRDPTSDAYTASRLGIWSTAVHLPWFSFVFEHATPPAGDWMMAHAAFVTAVGMPRAGTPVLTPMTQFEFDIVAEWFMRGVPDLDTVLPAGAAPTECLPGVSTEAVTHIASMATTGWAARNVADGMLMYGCAGAATPADCLASYPLARDTAFGAGWEAVPAGAGVAGARIRVLHTTDYDTAWWTRTSPDGRFISHGAAPAPHLRFIDLQTARVFGGDGLYDTSFFPDGSGFFIQGSARGARMCPQSVLTAGMPTMLTFTEPGCSSGGGVGLYEHLSTSLDGSDYWAIAGTATFDNGGQAPTLADPIVDFPVSASSNITQIVNTGTSFMIGSTFPVRHPYEGDAVMSPSFLTFLTRQGGATGQEGYVLHALRVTGTGAARTVSAPEIGRYCIDGAKPEFSYDERWMVTHHYVGDADAVALGFTGPADPGFAAYRTRGSSNVYLVNLGTGAQYRVTNMPAGQYALFPHFRSDGWIVFVVRQEGTIPEHMAASDAALLAPP